MKLRGRILAISVLVLALQALPGVGQTPPPRFVPFHGTQAFCNLLHSFGLKPLLEIADLEEHADETILIVFGDLGIFQHVSLAGFQSRYGNVLIASDRPFRGRFAGGRLNISAEKVTQDPSLAYQKAYVTCPVIRQFSNRQHPLLRNFSADKELGLATNGPSHLETRGPEQFSVPLGVFGPKCRTDQGDADGLVYLEASPANFGPHHRAVFLAGHGVFFNGMLVHQDNQNLQFARNCVNWLGEGAYPRAGNIPNKRKYALFIEEGNIVKTFNIPLTVTKLPPLPKGVPIPSADLVNQIVHGLEEENVFNRILWKWQDDLIEEYGRDSLVRPYAFLATFALLAFVGLLFMRSRFRQERFAPLVFSNMEPAVLPRSPQQLRNQELAQLDNYRDALQPLVRQWFWTQAGIDPSAWDGAVPPAPVIVGPGSWWRTLLLRRRIHYLCGMAQAVSVDRVNKAEFLRIGRSLSEVSADLHAAGLTLTPFATEPKARADST